MLWLAAEGPQCRPYVECVAAVSVWNQSIHGLADVTVPVAVCSSCAPTLFVQSVRVADLGTVIGATVDGGVFLVVQQSVQDCSEPCVFTRLWAVVE